MKWGMLLGMMLVFTGISILPGNANGGPVSGVGVTIGQTQSSSQIDTGTTVFNIYRFSCTGQSLEFDYQNVLSGHASLNYFFQYSMEYNQFKWPVRKNILGLGLRIWGAEEYFLGLHGGVYYMEVGENSYAKQQGILSGLVFGMESKSGLILRFEDNTLLPTENQNGFTASPGSMFRLSIGYRFGGE